MFYIVVSDLVLTIECTCCVHEALWCVVTTAAESCVLSELQDETGADVIIAVSLMGIVVCYENNQTSKLYRWVSSCDGVRMCDQAVMCGKNILACKIISKNLRTSVSQSRAFICECWVLTSEMRINCKCLQIWVDIKYCQKAWLQLLMEDKGVVYVYRTTTCKSKNICSWWHSQLCLRIIDVMC